MKFKKFSNFLIFFKLLGAYSDLLIWLNLISNHFSEALQSSTVFCAG